MTALLTVQDLSFSYQTTPALHNLSFELYSGEILAFLGLNGAGKSTALNLISGVLPISQGKVQIKQYDLQHEPVRAKTHLGYLPEHPPLYLQMRVEAYLRFAGGLRGLRGRALDQALAWVLDRCDLAAVADRWIKHLSQGFQQRIGIAQAIIHRPDLIVLDEPTVGLDPAQRKHILDLITDLAQDHAVIFSTHILSEVEQVASHVQILQQGHLRLAKTSLQADKQACLLLGIDVELNPALQKSLLALSGICDVNRRDDGLWQVFYTKKTSMQTVAMSLSQWVVQENLGLFSLQSAKDNLETIFWQITETSL